MTLFKIAPDDFVIRHILVPHPCGARWKAIASKMAVLPFFEPEVLFMALGHFILKSPPDFHQGGIFDWLWQ
jgi:hypothetical protein